MPNRFTVFSVLLASLVSVTMAQDMHVFSNNTVADADKINDNFAAIDQEGPTITFSEPVMETATSGTVTVTISDPSGVFGFGRAGQTYGIPYSIEEEQIVFEPHSAVTSEESIYLQYNESTSLVVFASDLRGNRSVKKVDYPGATSVAKAGIYEVDGQFVLPDLCDANGGPRTITALWTLLQASDEAPHPALDLAVGLCEYADYYSDGRVSCIPGGTTYSVMGQATDTVWSYDLDLPDSTYDRTLGLTFSADGLSVVVAYDEVADCSFVDGQVETHSDSATFTYLAKP